MLGRRRTEIGDLPGGGKVVERETRDGVRVSGFQRVVPFPPRRVLTTSVVCSVEIIREDGEEEAGVRAHTEETGVDFSSVGAALGIGECLRAFTSFSMFTFVFIIGGFPDVRVFTRLGAGTECNGYTVTGSCHSRYTESNMYSLCTRVELRLFVHVSDVLYRLHVTSVINTIYSSYQYLQYNEIEPMNGRPVTHMFRQFVCQCLSDNV